jgi:hypothetical protein
MFAGLSIRVQMLVSVFDEHVLMLQIAGVSVSFPHLEDKFAHDKDGPIPDSRLTLKAFERTR